MTLCQLFMWLDSCCSYYFILEVSFVFHCRIRKACWSLMFSQPQFLPFLSLLFPISGYTKIVQQKGRPLLRGLVRCSEYSSTAWVASSILRGSGCWQMALLLHCVELGCSCLWTFVSHPGTAFLSFLSTVGQLPSWSYWESYTKKKKKNARCGFFEQDEKRNSFPVH